MVPMHQLQALETGQGTHLPEDVYLRGFIKRIGTALELDNATLLASLPIPDPTQAILPSWYHPPTKSGGIKGLAVQPLHLYVGYAALMAGGLVWLSHQQTPETPPGAIQLDAPNVTTSPQSNQPHSLNSGSSIAPPERF
jgi:cytoskeleton protein RodZ